MPVPPRRAGVAQIPVLQLYTIHDGELVRAASFPASRAGGRARSYQIPLFVIAVFPGIFAMS